jgi:hypothetical protein
MTSETKIDPPEDASTAIDVAATPERLPAAEALARKVPNKGLLVAVAFGLALLVAAGALLVGLNKL